MKTSYKDAGATPSDMGVMPELGRFTPCIGEKFDVLEPPGSLPIELVEAKALPGRAGAPGEESFSLIFRAPSDCDLIEGSVALEHEKAGWVVLFLVLVGSDRDGRYFEAIID